MQSRLPIADRDWKLCEETIAAAEQASPHDYRVALLQLNLLLARDPQSGREVALAKLQELLQRFPDEAGLHALAVLPLEMFGDSKAADHSLLRWRTLAPQSLEPRLRSVELSILRKQLDPARSELLAIEPQLSWPERHRAARLWLQLETSAKQPETARAAWTRLAQAAPDDPFPILLLAEWELREHPSTTEHYEVKLRAIEGPDGAAWRYVRARRLLATASTTPAKRPEVQQLSQWLTQHRAGWPQTWLLHGVLAEQQEDWDRAIQAYQQVVTLDPGQLPVYQRLLRILYQQGRYSEVDRFVAALSARGPLSPESSLIAISSAAAQHEVDQAFTLAETAAKQDPKNVPAGLWLAHLQQVKGQPADAEQTLARLLQHAPGDPRVWGGQLAHYQSRGDRTRFASTLRDCEASTQLANQPKAKLLAQGYELLGYPERAAEHYLTALKDSQQDLALRLKLATVQMQFAPDQAEATLRTIRLQAPESSLARRMLAVTLAAHRRHDAWPEIQALLEPSDAATGAEDLRLEAILRMRQQQPEDIAQARRLFEQLTAQSKQPAAQDRQLLAMLYEQEGKLTEARREYLALAESAQATPDQWVAFIGFCLRQRDPATAMPWIAKLRLKTDDPWKVWPLQVVAFHIADQKSELAALLQSLESQPRPASGKPNELRKYHLQMADIYRNLQRPADTERHLRALAVALPAQTSTLVNWLIAERRPAEALQVAFSTYHHEQTLDNLALLTEVVPLVTEMSELLAQTNLLIVKLTQESHDPQILALVSNLRIKQERTEEAIMLLRQVIALAPNDFLALNNLAALLADRDGEQAAALGYIDRGIAAAPRPLPFLFDTRAKVLLHHDR
ncbi:MAG TPA: tetratricopeptide repeat protein, partial [Pirellulaceae bacterium]|nr:tetratricopeptide repeat protein [Pirellulaceae bacterium]